MEEPKDRRDGDRSDPFYEARREPPAGGQAYGQGQPPAGMPYDRQPQGQNQFGQPFYPQNNPYRQPVYQENQKTNVSAILSLIFGVVAAVLGWVPYLSLITFPLAIAAIPLGAVGMKSRRKGYGMGIAGMVIGIVYLSIMILLIFFAMFVFGSVFAGMFGR